MVADLNGDGIDGLIVCNMKARALMFVQDASGSWTDLKIIGVRSKDWRNARITDITGDGIVDIVVAGWVGYALILANRI